MKTYIEISQPTTTSNLLVTLVEKLQSSLQSLNDKVKALSLRNRLILVALVMATATLILGCNLFSLILIALFLIALGVVINEFVEYIRFIRELEMFYYRGIQQWPHIKSYLMDTCLTDQDRYKELLDRMGIAY